MGSIQQPPTADRTAYSVSVSDQTQSRPVNDVDRWFERTARRKRTPVSLYSCLLTGRLGSYFAYRLRYPFLIATVRFAVHVAEFFILLSSLGGVAAFTVMVLRAGSLIVAGGWWGLLEVMRERLRRFARTGQPEASEYEIGRWLVLSAIAGLVVTVAGAAAVWALSREGSDPVARLYAFLIVVELAIDLAVRALHSGIYATRRVYKPIWSMFVPTVVQLAILGCGFFFYPAAAIVISIILSNAIGIWITVHYCLEAYRLMGLRPRLARSGTPWWRQLPRIPFRLGFETTMAGLSLRLDAVLVLALIGFYGTDTRAFDLTAGMANWQNIDAFQFFYLILPLFRSTYDSAGIFYFDLVRLRRSPTIRRLQLLFFHRLLLITPIIALFFWSLAALLALAVLDDVPFSFLLALFPMFVLRSAIGVYQMRLFADGRFSFHVATLGLLIVLLWLVWLNPNPAGDLIQITAAMTIQLIVLMNAQHLRDRRDPEPPVLLPLRQWVQSLLREPGTTVSGTITVPRSILPKQKSAVMDLMRQRFDGVGHFAHRSPNTLLYYIREQHGSNGVDPFQFHLALQELSGGAARDGGISRREGDPLPATVAVADPPAHRDLTDLAGRFRTLFPDGIVYDTDDLRGARRLGVLNQRLIAAVLPAILSGDDDGSDILTVSGRRLTPIFESGELRMILVLPDDPEPQRLRDWRGEWALWSFHA